MITVADGTKGNGDRPPTKKESTPLLRVEGLGVAFPARHGELRVIHEATFEILGSQIHGLVGESGSGKSVLASAVAGLLGDAGGRIVAGSAQLDGVDLGTASDRELAGLRGPTVAMIFQQPGRSLNPAFTVGEQIAEGLRVHAGLNRREAFERAVALLADVRIPNPRRRARDYPHMFSGGMAQRAMIACALALSPKLLIADEPTTALDVTVQATILELLEELSTTRDMAVLHITHDLAVAANTCDVVTVMYAGQTVESASAASLFAAPRHPYTAGLIASSPQIGRPKGFDSIPGSVPAPYRTIQGCRFGERCDSFRSGPCGSKDIPEVQFEDRHWVRCARVEELAREAEA